MASPLHPEQAPAQCWLTAAPVPMTMSRQVYIIISHLCMEERKPQPSFSCDLFPFLLYDVISSQSCPSFVWHSRLNCIVKITTSQKLCSFFSSFWKTWRKGKISYGSQSFLSVPCILNGSVFIEHQQFSVLKRNT